MDNYNLVLEAMIKFKRAKSLDEEAICVIGLSDKLDSCDVAFALLRSTQERLNRIVGGLIVGEEEIEKFTSAMEGDKEDELRF